MTYIHVIVVKYVTLASASFVIANQYCWW